MAHARRHREAPIMIVYHGQLFQTFRCRFCNARDTSRELLRQHERQHESVNRWIKMQAQILLLVTRREGNGKDHQSRDRRGLMAEGIRLANGIVRGVRDRWRDYDSRAKT
jgi:hypothetical protein